MLILAILAFGFLCGWLAQIILGLGSKPDGRTLKAIAIKTPPQAPDDTKMLN